MSKIRIYSLAKELGIDNQKMLEALADLGITYKSASSTLDEETVEMVKALLAEENAAASNNPEPEVSTTEAETDPSREHVPHRAPVVTIMGHVDHGKTSLLDYIRKSKVAAKEAGGITQHVGAFEAKTSRGKIVFIDTPGHEAFTTIRARGAKVADIAIIVVAADDSIMPQTREAVAHAQAAKVPIIVAINKIDLPSANPDRVKTDLMQLSLVPEEFGGQTPTIPVSARTGAGVDDLLEYISLVAEMEDLRADPNAPLKAVVIESKIDKQAGVQANIMVQEGTLHVSDFLVVGENYGKVKALTDSFGERVKTVGPSTPVQVMAFSEAPHSGDTVVATKNEHEARALIAERKEKRREAEEAADRRKTRSLDDIFGSLEEIREINLILRADTQGSLEAIQGILARQQTDGVEMNVLLAAIGSPTESDVLLASTAQATILCFNTTASGAVKKAGEQRGIEVKSFRIIYELIEEVERLLKGDVEPVFEERYLGKAEVRMIISHPKFGTIAGSYVQDGSLKRNAKVLVKRKGKEVYKGTIIGLKRFKDDVREVQSGYECGINIDWDEVQEGDIIEASEMVEVTA